MTNYYESLGVTESATADEIKKAYRDLAKKCHPDLHPNDKEAEARFKTIQEAYDTLSDESKRHNYDFFRRTGADPATARVRHTSVNDVFNEFYRNTQHQAQMEGQDVELEIRCSFEETIRGKSRNLTLHTNEVCKTCNGEGLKKNARKGTCTKCKGKGQVVTTQDFGGRRIVQIASICNKCEGSGVTVNDEDRCEKCKNGLCDVEEKIEVDIPAGIHLGAALRLVNRGRYINPKGRKGHVYLRIVPEKHEFFEMTSNFDLVLPLYLSPSELIMGITLDIPMIDGKTESLVIPAGTNHGDKFWFRGKGLFSSSREREDLIVVVQSETMKTSEEVEKLAKKLRAIENADTLPRTMQSRSKLLKYMKKE
jgi:molecular chaperone DnaJ